jgi:hypothetical protein
MALPKPFAYPRAAHVSRHAPAGYKNYQDYKPWLRDEFEFRCVYCLQREVWSRDRDAVFSVDHVIPQSEDPDSPLVCDYNNLVYACLRCNSARQAVPVLNPREEGLGRHLRVGADGSITGLTEEGQILIELLHLDTGAAPAERRRILRLLDRWRRDPEGRGVRTDFLETFGYPKDLPNLRRLKPPRGNALSANTKHCFLARRERGELPETY